MKKGLILVVLASIAIGYASCTKEKVTDVTLNKNEVFLVIGKTETLIATVQPDDVSNKKVTWKSSNPSVATVSDNGLVTAIKDGNAIITVTTQNGKKTATCFVSVDYRNKWIGEYVGEYISILSLHFDGATYDTINECVVIISIGEDSCLIIKTCNDREFRPKINTNGHFIQDGQYIIIGLPKCKGYVLNDSINFEGTLSRSLGHHYYHIFKGKKQ